MNIKKLAISALASSLVGATAAQAAVFTYTDKTAFLAAAFGLTLVDFEAQQTANSFPRQTYYGASLNVGAVTFTQADASMFVFGPEVYGSFTTNYLNRNAGSNLVINFASGVNAVGMDLGCLQFAVSCPNTTTMTLSNGEIVSAASPNILAGPMEFIGFISSSAFTSIDISDPSNGTSIDNFYFGNGNVPEPASLALIGLGLAGLGFSRRKKA